MKTVFLVLFCTLWCSRATAQGTDYQFRPLVHKQFTSEGGNGLGFWGIVPDATQNKPSKILLVGGLLFKESENWLELMAGSFVKTDGALEPAVNVRASLRASRFLVYAEAMYNLPKKRLIVPLAVTRRVSLGSVNLGLGLESETTIGNGGDSWGLGPRIVVPIPFLKKASLATVYQWQSRQPFVRQYLLVSF
ncbi:MAG: hypothetical protein HY378_00290 [Candidatus Brennerbacteria bacterium]|nr:hypothetical protein [Candidatus Brennerbacteria bacterium]